MVPFSCSEWTSSYTAFLNRDFILCTAHQQRNETHMNPHEIHIRVGFLKKHLK